MSRRPTVTKTQSTLAPLPSLPSASSEPIPEAQQHLEARRRRLSLRPHRLSVSSAVSRSSDVSGSKRRKAIDMEVGLRAEPEPDPEYVVRVDSGPGALPSDVHVADRRNSSDEESKDVYEWVVLYENQRGITIFSVPYYSKLSLLPSDPPPFTVPNHPAGHGQGKTRQRGTLRAPGALTDYQLPDPNWRWVSKYWMVDMRGDGEVQQDGYEYNWCFRSKGWRTSVGSFNAGGWVRRRRWVRLMMRPANVHAVPALPNSTDISITRPVSGVPSPVSSLPEDSDSDGDGEDTRIWRGDADDWTRVRSALREFRSDGRRLEAWEGWLSLEERALLAHATARLGIGVRGGKMRHDEWDARHALDPISPLSDDITPGTAGTKPAPPSRDILLPVLRNNFHSILGTFVFPDSRAQFLELLRLAGFDEVSIPDLASFDSHSDFWSLARSSSPLSSPHQIHSMLSSR